MGQKKGSKKNIMANNSGGKFILDSFAKGVQEKFLINYKLLNKYFLEREGCSTMPFLIETERTHENYIKKYYRPILPMAFEVRAELAETGTIDFGTNVFSLPSYGDFIYEMTLFIELENLSTVNPAELCGYVDFLGHRLIKKVQMDFAGQIIDEYSGEAYNPYFNYFVGADERKSYLRSIGQEVPEKLILDQEGYREQKKILFGPQTPKQAHSSVKLNIPIIFDFSRKLDASLFSAKIPYGMRYLRVTLNNPSDLVYLRGTGGLNLPTIKGSLILTHVFIDPQIRSRLQLGKYKTLIRVFKETDFTASTLGTQKIDQFRFPLENIFFGIKPVANTLPHNWYKYTSSTVIPATFPIATAFTGPPFQLQFRTENFELPQPTLTTFSFLTRNTQVTNDLPIEYFNSAYASNKGKSSKDSGLIGLTFGRALCEKNITGFYNVSTEREFYVKYTSTMPGNFYLLATCINWLTINEAGVVSLLYPS